MKHKSSSVWIKGERWSRYEFEKLVLEPVKQQINTAFALMRKNGLLSRQNFMCCGSCAGYALNEALKKEGNDKIGCVYYHKQDTEHFNNDGHLYLGYGSIDDSEEASLQVGAVVMQALMDAGLSVEWNGDASTRILVKAVA